MIKTQESAKHFARSAIMGFGICTVLLGTGCSNPFRTYDADLGKRVSIAQLQNIQPLDLKSHQAPLPEQNAMADPLADRFAGVQKMEFSIERVRQATLENNMDLRVAMVNPNIAKESISQEEARFEAAFNTRLIYREDDSPSFNITSFNQQDSVFTSNGVQIPLRTGGSVSVDLIEQWRQTNNPFVTLNTSYDSSLRFSVSQPLLRNAGRRTNTHALRIAALNQQVSQAQTKLEVIRQIAGVDRAYWRLYAAQQALEVTQKQYELALVQLQRARRRVQAGASAEVEIMRAEAGLAQRLESIIIAENLIKNRQRDLKRIMNIPGLSMDTTTHLTIQTLPDPVPYKFASSDLMQQALENRMEMLELELRLAQDASTIAFNKNQSLPLFTLDYAYNIQGLGSMFRESNSVLIDNNFESWSVGLTGQIPIGNEAAKSRIRQSVLARLQRLATRESRKLAIEQEVLTSIDNVNAAWQRIMAARQSAAATARTYDAEQRQFEVGARTSTDVLDAATSLADAQLSEIRAITDYQISLVDLSFATGTLLGASKIDWQPIDPRNDPNWPVPASPGSENEANMIDTLTNTSDQPNN